MGGDGERIDPRALEAALELADEEQVRELALTVRPRGIVGPLGVQIVEVDLPEPVHGGAHADDAGARRSPDARKEQAGESEVVEMIRADMSMETVIVHAAGRR